jgi:Tfp pilus assembly protein PilF
MNEPKPPGQAEIRAEVERHLKTAGEAMAAGRVAEAAQIHAALARAFPASAVFHANLGACLRRLGRSEAALASFRRAHALAPNEAGVLSTLGNALRDLGRIGEAIVAQEGALALAPGQRVLRFNYALTLRDARRHDEALRLLRELAAEFPDDAEYAFDLALTQLQTGDLREGFRGYEARWRLARNRTPLRDGPQWEGGSLTGKRIFLQSEPGFGDTIQFVRFVPRLAQRGARVVLECLPELQRLFAGVEGVAATVLKGADAPAADVSAPLLSLPRLFAAKLTDLPARVPYLKAPGPITGSSPVTLPPFAGRAARRAPSRCAKAAARRRRWSAADFRRSRAAPGEPGASPRSTDPVFRQPPSFPRRMVASGPCFGSPVRRRGDGAPQGATSFRSRPARGCESADAERATPSGAPSRRFSGPAVPVRQAPGRACVRKAAFVVFALRRPASSSRTGL